MFRARGHCVSFLKKMNEGALPDEDGTGNNRGNPGPRTATAGVMSPSVRKLRDVLADSADRQSYVPRSQANVTSALTGVYRDILCRARKNQIEWWFCMA
jgi:hypothetical protein